MTVTGQLVAVAPSFLLPSLGGLILAVLLVLYYLLRIRRTLTQVEEGGEEATYYHRLTSVGLTSALVFLLLFEYLVLTELTTMYDWIRAVMDALMFIYLGVSYALGERLLESMTTIQQRHGI